MSESKVLLPELLNEQARYWQQQIGRWTQLVSELQKSAGTDVRHAPAQKYWEAWSDYCRDCYGEFDQHIGRYRQILECDKGMQEWLSGGNLMPQFSNLFQIKGQSDAA